MLMLLRFGLPLPPLQRIHDHRNRSNDTHSRNDPGQDLNNLNLVTFAQTALDNSNTAAFFVAPHVVNESARDNPKYGREEEEDGV